MDLTAIAVAPILATLSYLIYQFVPLKGFAMAIFVLITAILVAVGDIIVTGGLASITGPNVAADFTIIYGLATIIYKALYHNAPGDAQGTVQLTNTLTNTTPTAVK
jgi:hypothetical protein